MLILALILVSRRTNVLYIDQTGFRDTPNSSILMDKYNQFYIEQDLNLSYRYQKKP